MRWPVLAYGILAYLLGIRSLIYFVFFSSNVPLVKTVDSGPASTWGAAIAIDLLLLGFFGVTHSLLARDRFKTAFRRWFSEPMLRSTYVLVAALSLSLLMWQWRPIDAVVWETTSPLGSNVLLGLSVAGWLLAAIAYYTVGHLQLLGLRQSFRYFRRQPEESDRLVTTGVYRVLRDPMYLGFAIGIWSAPRMTAGHLLLGVGLSFYLLIGMRYERRDLVSRFGDRYLQYIGQLIAR